MALCQFMAQLYTLVKLKLSNLISAFCLVSVLCVYCVGVESVRLLSHLLHPRQAQVRLVVRCAHYIFFVSKSELFYHSSSSSSLTFNILEVDLCISKYINVVH